MSEQFIDGEACRLFDNTMKWWHGDGNVPANMTWDNITEELRDTYRQSVINRRIYSSQYNEQH